MRIVINASKNIYYIAQDSLNDMCFVIENWLKGSQ